MCVSCHAKKTQSDWIALRQSKQNVGGTATDDDRTDIVVAGGKLFQCSVCGERRPVTTLWESHECRGKSLPAGIRQYLSQFAYRPTHQS